MTKENLLNQLKGGLIVSCQALEHEHLHSSHIMSLMAKAANDAGAVGIRANSAADIVEIKNTTTLPIIGIVKKDYVKSDVYITPTIKEVDELVAVGCEIIATDATNRLRPFEQTLEEFYKEIREKYPNQIFMADCSTFEEGVKAQQLGFDIVSTTMCGYTSYTKGQKIPSLQLICELGKTLDVPVIAEGGIWSPEQLRECLGKGAFACVVGSAITRPYEIAKRFVEATKINNNN